MWIRLLIVLVSLVPSGTEALANDSTARIAAGSIVFLKSEHIRLVKEDLEISTRAIRVRYKFLNESAKDIKTTVAFPMPPYRWDPEERDRRNVRPLEFFQLLVDEKQVSAKVIQKAVVNGRDITEGLRSIGLNDSQIFRIFADCEYDGRHMRCQITKEQESAIAQVLGQTRFSPDWEISGTIYWNMVFPAGREIEIKHQYPPFVGQTQQQTFLDEWEYVQTLPNARDSSDDPDETCLDDGTRGAIDREIRSLMEDRAEEVFVTLNDVEYILGTGRNWKGPITEFKLRIKRESPKEFVSLCFPGRPKKVDLLTLEFSQRNYVPQDRLVVHFYTVWKGN